MVVFRKPVWVNYKNTYEVRDSHEKCVLFVYQKKVWEELLLKVLFCSNRFVSLAFTHSIVQSGNLHCRAQHQAAARASPEGASAYFNTAPFLLTVLRLNQLNMYTNTVLQLSRLTGR